MNLNSMSILNSRVGVALISALLLPVIVFLIGLILEGAKLAFIEFISMFVGYSVALYIVNYLTFVGTIHHELSHALFAFIFGAKIKKIEVFNPHEGTLGQVLYYPRGHFILQNIQITLSSTAPVICGFISLRLLTMNYNNAILHGVPKAVLIYLLVSIFLHMTMSAQDIKVSLMGLPVCIVVTFFIFLILKFNLMTYILDVVPTIFNLFVKMLNGSI